MATEETFYNIPSDHKIVKVSANIFDILNHFQNEFEIDINRDNIESYLTQYYEGSATLFDIQQNNEKIVLTWGVPRSESEADKLNKKALQFAKQRQFKEAIEEWKKAININNLDPDFHYNIGLAYFEVKNYTNGINRCNEALVICPIYYRAHLVLGSIYSKMRKFEEAKFHIQSGLLFQPSNVAALVNLGAVYSILREYDKAINAFEKAVSKSPREVKAHLGLGKIYALQGDYENANRCFKVVIKLDPEGKLGVIAKNSLKTPTLQGASQELDENLDFSDQQILDSDTLYTTGYQAYLHGEYERASSIFARYLEKEKQDANVWSLAATCYLRLGQKDKALSAIEQAIDLSQGRANFFKHASIIYDAFDLQEKAGKAIQKAYDLGKRDSVTLTLLGISKLESKQTQDSIRYLQEALNMNPNNLKARYYFAQALLELGQKDSARQQFEEILWSQNTTPLKEKAKVALKEIS